ncbi:MAG: response regulator transcription factor [Lachnospiraceae bacterium]|nr:response regulator transcription factor [Lachnospiraceae bacterium]
MPKILVVEDNRDYQELLQNFLESAHYAVETADDGDRALWRIGTEPFDLILLDLMLPGMDGFDVCREIRKKCDTPVIMLTALDSETCQMQGYELQIDDYITKPVSMALLLQKVAAVLRRTMPSTAVSTPDILRCGDIALDLKAHQVRAADEPVAFTLREFEILRELMLAPGTVVTRKDLIEKLWGYDFYGDTRIIDTHMKNIRHKLGASDCIETVRGIGYKLGN